MSRVVIWTAAWLFGVAVLAGLALWWQAGDHIFLGRYTGYVMPWLATVLAPAAAAAWATRRRALALVLGASLLSIAAVHAPHFAPRPPRAAAGVPLRVMSYNTWSKNEDAPRIAGVVRSVAPDVLLLQETLPHVFAALIDELGDLYGSATVHRAYDPELLQAVVSRYPVEAGDRMKHKGQAQLATVHAPSGPIAVFNAHPLRNGGWRHRYGQIAALLEEEVLTQTLPVLVAGDFNSPEHSQLYALAARHLTNAHDSAGAGLGFTYPTPAVQLFGILPAFSVVRIDHIFFSRDVAAVRAGTLADHGGSDHRPVFADLVLPGRGARASSSARIP
jgi:endonuclease/exonuclease/phosphatase family metal-dependent hydrolase